MIQFHFDFIRGSARVNYRASYTSFLQHEISTKTGKGRAGSPADRCGRVRERELCDRRTRMFRSASGLGRQLGKVGPLLVPVPNVHKTHVHGLDLLAFRRNQDCLVLYSIARFGHQFAFHAARRGSRSRAENSREVREEKVNMENTSVRRVTVLPKSERRQFFVCIVVSLIERLSCSFALHNPVHIYVFPFCVFSFRKWNASGFLNSEITNEVEKSTGKKDVTYRCVSAGNEDNLKFAVLKNK